MAVYDSRTEAELREAFSPLRWQDPPSFETWLQEVRAAQRTGYAIDADRYVRGVTTVASPVLETGARPVMAVSAVGFSAQFTPVSLTGLASAVKECAEALSVAIAGEVAKHNTAPHRRTA
ncbi:IclR family transcriptional regulator C-terminal domain-containing protein [Pseudoroseomonas wenyumeiae]